MKQRAYGGKLTDDLFERMKPLLNNCKIRTFRRKQIILFQGEAPRNGYLIKSGVVRVYNITQNGESQLITLIGPGELFPDSWLFKLAPNALYFYEAVSDTESYLLPRDAFHEHIRGSHELVLGLLEYYAASYTGALMQVNALSQTRASEKLLYMLLYLAERFGIKDKKKNINYISMALTHQQIAQLVGLTRETVTIEINRLKHRGIISLNDRRYAVNISKLLSAIGEESILQ